TDRIGAQARACRCQELFCHPRRVNQFTCAARQCVALAPTGLAAANNVCGLRRKLTRFSDARRHQPRRPPLAKIRPGVAFGAPTPACVYPAIRDGWPTGDSNPPRPGDPGKVAILCSRCFAVIEFLLMTALAFI